MSKKVVRRHYDGLQVFNIIENASRPSGQVFSIGASLPAPAARPIARPVAFPSGF
jgi:hypothetical protein